MDISHYSQSEFLSAKELITQSLTAGIRQTSAPKAFLLGGQSGAGKSKFHRLVGEATDGNLIIIDGDTFREAHPNSELLTKTYGKADVKYTAKFAGQMVEELVEELSDSDYNLLIEGTLRTFEVPLKTAEMLSQKGYESELLVMTVNPLISYLSTLTRYEEAYSIKPELARATPKEHHDLIVKNIPNNLDTLYKSGTFTNIRLLNRAGETLYSQKETPDLSPREVFDEMLESNLSKDEVHMATSSINRTIELLERRDVSDPEVQNTMKELVSIAEAVAKINDKNTKEKFSL
ncbi:UDP-N-acetylglucosamine kinase [Enterococcus sp. AZ194]|uniref:zeta toxin family protein n=1 Tax=Enterococcus sp. AZ194 TaxID=2774629 RepID=UPI003F1FCDBF